MSSSRKSGSVSSNSRRHSRLARDTRWPAGPVRHTLRSQIQSNPISAARSSSASGTSSKVAGPTQRPGPLRQPDAGIELIEGRIEGVAHVSACGREPSLRAGHAAPAPLP
jgi:hypothetical protein